MGEVESKQAEQESLLLEYEVPYRPFGKAILKCLPEEGETWKVPSKTEGNLAWRDREDLRDLLVCSIDPPGKLEVVVGLSARKLTTCTFVRQVARISTMLFMLDYFQMVT